MRTPELKCHRREPAHNPDMTPQTGAAMESADTDIITILLHSRYV